MLSLYTLLVKCNSTNSSACTSVCVKHYNCSCSHVELLLLGQPSMTPPCVLAPAGRQNPGLSPQHLTGLQLVANITGGNLTGGAIRSSTIRCAPPTASKHGIGTQRAETATAGTLHTSVRHSTHCLQVVSNAGHAVRCDARLPSCICAPQSNHSMHFCHPQRTGMLCCELCPQLEPWPQPSPDWHL